MPSPKSYVKKEQLEYLAFKKMGRIEYNSKTYKLDYKVDRIDQYVYESNCVYLWGLSLPNRQDYDLQICYIGQTGHNIYHRRSTWQSGLNAGHKKRVASLGTEEVLPGRGNQVRRKIIAAFNAGSELSVWVRLSSYDEVLGERVAMAKVEEDALIQKFEPSWNWHGSGSRYDENDNPL